MQETDEKPKSVAAFYRERIANRKPGDAQKGENNNPAQQNADKKPAGNGVFEVSCVLLSLFLFSTSAFAGLSSVSIGASVQFKKYELVKVLDQHFTVEMKSGATTPFDTEEELGEKTIIIL